MYQIRIEKSVLKAVEKIYDPYYTNIKKAILDLASNPRPIGSIKLKGRDGFRIRVNDYRIIYDIYEEILTIEVIDIGHRKNIYT